MKTKRLLRWSGLQVIALLVVYGGISRSPASAVLLGHIEADRILFLGNSITLHGPYPGWNDWAHWGMAASEESKDYVHVLTDSINAATGGSLTVAHPEPLPDRWYPWYPPPNYIGNVLNVADIFERNFDSWENGRIYNQLYEQPNIVVLQFGENLDGGTPAELSTALNTMLTGMKNAGDPHIFITSSILGPDPDIDLIKQQACAADPEHRVFVNLNGIVDNSGAAGHPSDAGMQTIASSLYNAMVAHSAGDPPPAWRLGIDINGRSSTSQTNVTRSGAAAIGATGDVWNGYAVDAAGVSPLPILNPAQSGFLVDAVGSTTTVKFDLTTVGADAPLATGDDMANDLVFVEGLNAGSGFPTSATFTLSGLQAGDVYDMYFYVANAATAYATKFTIDGLSGSTQANSVFTGAWRHGRDYVRFPHVTVAADGTIQGVVESANPTNYGVFCGLQMTTAEPADQPLGVPVSIDINGKGLPSQTNVTKTGAAAIGAAGDVWNGYATDASGSTPNTVDPAQSGFLLDANGNLTTIKFDLSLVGADAPMASSDDMANDVAFVEGASAGTGFPLSATFTLSGLDAGEAYDLYLYAAPAADAYASKFTIDGTTQSTAQGSVFTGIWVEDDNYVKFSDVVAAGDGTIVGLFESGNAFNYGVFSGLQIVPSSPDFIPGDANGDGVVNNEDASILGANWRRTGDATWALGDFNGDNNVDDRDAAILAANWGATAEGEQVPEPSTATLLLVGAVALLGMARRRRSA